MDTAKAANLFVNYPDADMFDFINAPIGKGKPIDRKLSPLVCSKCTSRRCIRECALTAQFRPRL